MRLRPRSRRDIEQAKWAVVLLSRENPPGSFYVAEDRGIDIDEVDVEAAIGGLSRAVSRGDIEERLEAVGALIWTDDRRMISPLLRALRDPIWHVRYEACVGLALFGPLPEWALPPLEATISDVESCVRMTAVRALGSLPSTASVRALVPALSDDARGVRLEAVRAIEILGRCSVRTASAAEWLAYVLWEDPDPFVAYAAYWALGRIGAPRFDSERARFRWSERGRYLWRIVVGP